MHPIGRAASLASQLVLRRLLPAAIAVLLELSPLVAIAIVLKVA